VACSERRIRGGKQHCGARHPVGMSALQHIIRPGHDRPRNPGATRYAGKQQCDALTDITLPMTHIYDTYQNIHVQHNQATAILLFRGEPHCIVFSIQNRLHRSQSFLTIHNAALQKKMLCRCVQLCICRTAVHANQDTLAVHRRLP
jgi:hypothetical protein